MSQLQLQFWDPKAREYVPSGYACNVDKPHDIEALKDSARGKGRSWRVCKPERERKNPRIPMPRQSVASARSIHDVQCDYLEWAQRAGLKRVTAYSAKPPANHRRVDSWPKKRFLGPMLFLGAFDWTTPDAQFAVEESQEA